MPEATQPVGNALTDSTGVSKLTGSKVVKDLVADFLLSAAAALASVQIVGIDSAIAQPTVVAFAVGGAVIRVLYRFVLRWATS